LKNKTIGYLNQFALSVAYITSAALRQLFGDVVNVHMSEDDGCITVRGFLGSFWHDEIDEVPERAIEKSAPKPENANFPAAKSKNNNVVCDDLLHQSIRTTERYTHVAKKDVLRLKSPFDTQNTD
jgi:hypothetical protein